MEITIAVISWLFFAIALVMKSYANRMRFMSYIDMPLIFSRSAGFVTKFWLTRLSITYLSLAGVWYAHGWRIMLITFIFYLIFSMFTFARGCRYQVNKWAKIDFEGKKKEAEQKGESFDKVTEWCESWNVSKRHVEEFMRNNGKL